MHFSSAFYLADSPVFLALNRSRNLLLMASLYYSELHGGEEEEVHAYIGANKIELKCFIFELSTNLVSPLGKIKEDHRCMLHYRKWSLTCFICGKMSKNNWVDMVHDCKHQPPENKHVKLTAKLMEYQQLRYIVRNINQQFWNKFSLTRNIC